MKRLFLIFALLIGFQSFAGNPIVVDDATGERLSGVSVFSRDGVCIGMSGERGTLPYASPSSYPLTLRCIGYKDATGVQRSDTVIRLIENTFQLSDVVVQSKKHQVLHILAFVRDYSTLSTYSDTVTLFREKWVDFMLPFGSGSDPLRMGGLTGWRTPRILSSKSYYRFKNANGLDSVSDRFNQHFSWTDWVGVIDRVDIPGMLRQTPLGVDTVYGQYSPTEMWKRRGDDISLRVNVLADTLSQRWAPDFTPFFRTYLDFEKFIINYDFRNVDTDDRVYARDLAAITCNIESRGRGRDMFRFNRHDEPFFVSTYSEIFVVDKSYITLKDAKKWRDRKTLDIDTYINALPDAVP